MKRRHFIQGAVAAGGALAFPAIVTGQSQYKAEYKLSTVVGPAFPWGKGGEIWGNLVKEKTNGRINIKMYPGVSLVQGDQTREFSAIRQGVIDMAIGSTINWSRRLLRKRPKSWPSARSRSRNWTMEIWFCAAMLAMARSTSPSSTLAPLSRA